MKQIQPPNYTQIPNTLLDSLDKFSSQSELKVVLLIARKTFGWHKGRDVISLSQIEEATGLARQSVLDGIELGIEHGWIERRAAGNSWSYAMVVQKLDQPDQSTSLETGPEIVQKVDQQVVQKVDTQKKEENKSKETGLTPAAVFYFETFKRKRWANEAQAVLFASLEAEVGPDVLTAAIRWAAEKGTPDLHAIRTTAKRMQSGPKPAAGQPVRAAGSGPWGSRPSTSR